MSQEFSMRRLVITGLKILGQIALAILVFYLVFAPIAVCRLEKEITRLELEWEGIE